MPLNPEEFKEGSIKLAIYIFGTMLGLASKLSKVAQLRKLNKKDIIIHTLIAFTCAFLVWHILDYYGKKDMASILSVIVGRFGDEIILLIYDKIKLFFDSLKQPIKNNIK